MLNYSCAVSSLVLKIINYKIMNGEKCLIASTGRSLLYNETNGKWSCELHIRRLKHFICVTLPQKLNKQKLEINIWNSAIERITAEHVQPQLPTTAARQRGFNSLLRFNAVKCSSDLQLCTWLASGLFQEMQPTLWTICAHSDRFDVKNLSTFLCSFSRKC